MRNLPTWRLAFAFITPLGLSILWFVMTLRAGQTAWAIFFGVLVAASAGLILTALVLKARARAESN